jgi:Growth-arrest specific micro-tubule binding
MKKHDKAFQEIKAYYNDITLNNLELIKSLKVFPSLTPLSLFLSFSSLSFSPFFLSYLSLLFFLSFSSLSLLSFSPLSLSHITSKEQVDELKKKDQAGEKLLMEVTQENKRLSEPLQKSLAEVTQLKHELSNYDKV